MRLFDAISLQVRHLVQAPHWSMYKETSAGLLAPKATAGFMNCAWFVRKQWTMNNLALQASDPKITVVKAVTTLHYVDL